MKNQFFSGTPTQPRFALCPTTVKAGDFVLVGAEPAVALDDYQSNLGGTVFYFGGSFFNAPVYGETQHSPQVAAGIKPGAKLYAAGSLDSTTNVTTSLIINADSSKTAFGFLDPSYTSGVTSGATDTSAPVRLQGAE